jgi:hypothetical protein
VQHLVQQVLPLASKALRVLFAHRCCSQASPS